MGERVQRVSLIAAYLNDSITITPKGARLYDGRSADGTPVNTTADIRDKTGYVRDKDGNEITYTRIVYLDPSETIAVGDKVTFQSVEHIVVAVKRNQDLAGTAQQIRAMIA